MFFAPRGELSDDDGDINDGKLIEKLLHGVHERSLKISQVIK